jgi:arsenite-transporting ATPase
VLIVSTDPAHSLRDVFAIGGRRGADASGIGGRRDAAPKPSPHSNRRLPSRPWRVAARLHAVELDADAALARWIGERRSALRRIVGRGTYLDDADIDALLRLAFPGVDELIGLLELRRLAASGPWDSVIVDTAPTGHTLRLLAMPATLSRIAVVLDDMQAKHRFLAQSLGGRHRPDVADALVNEIADAGRDLAALLRDRARVRVSWVLLPETLSLAEARDGVGALERSGIGVDELVVNRITPPPPSRCTLCDGRRAAEGDVLRAARATWSDRPMRGLPALEREPRGAGPLRALARQARDVDRFASPARRAARPRKISTHTAVADERWLSRLAPPGRALLLFAGKGGVGKTTCATASALGLAARPGAPRVLVLSTDPAHSLSDALGTDVGDVASTVPDAPSNVRAREIDASALFAARRQRYLETVDAVFDALRGGSRFDPTYDRVVVEDLIDLAPPGIDELLGILEVTGALGLDGGAPVCDVAVVDTAPTGHALRLLAMPEAALEWVHAFMTILLKYRTVMGLGELGQDLVTIARELRALRALLSDPRRASVVAVTRAAELPRLETRRLLAELRALRVTVGAVIVNALTPPGCARCRRTAAVETRTVSALRRDVAAQASAACAIIQTSAVAPPPRGPAALDAWRRTWAAPSLKT